MCNQLATKTTILFRFDSLVAVAAAVNSTKNRYAVE
jgi:hypothetical protein